MGYAQRISYRFTFAGREYHGVNVTIGDTGNKNWYKDEAGKGRRGHKWAAIYNALPGLFDELNAATNYDIYSLNPGDFGFRFTQLDKGE